MYAYAIIGGLAITSVHRGYATLQGTLEEAVDDRLIATNPVDGTHRECCSLHR